MVCSIKTKDFIRLYLDVGALSGAQCQLADDDISLSSIEESKCDEDENDGEDEKSQLSQSQEDTKDSHDDDNSESNDAGVVDLTCSPERPRSEPLQSSHTKKSKDDDDDDDDPQRQNNLRRLSRIAKKFKKQYLQKSAQYKEQYTEKRKLSDRIRQAEGDLKSLKDEMSEIEKDKGLFQLMMNESKLDLVRIRQERDVLRARCLTIHKDKIQAEARLQECHIFYKKELDEARAKSMSEVQEIMEEHPKVVEENRLLKQRLQKLELQRRDRSLSREDSRSNNEASRKAINIHKALREMDEASRFPPQNSSSTKRSSIVKNPFETEASAQTLKRSNRRIHDSTYKVERPSLKKVNSGQYSSFASRMIKASDKAKKPPPGTAAGKKRSSLVDHFLSSSSSQNKRMKSVSASRRDLFQRRP